MEMNNSILPENAKVFDLVRGGVVIPSDLNQWV
jgi:hypothetical protein